MLNIQKDVLLAPLTTFCIGGNAKYFIEVKDEDILHEAIAWAREHEVAFVILAGGSNVLVSDDGFDGLVIKMMLTEMNIDSTTVTVGAGVILLDMIQSAAAQGLGGLSGMAGIPGTVGGAVRGNAGAFGREVKDVVVEVKALNIDTGEVQSFKNDIQDRGDEENGEDTCQFDYRQSFFKNHPEWIILFVTFELKKEDVSIIESKIAKTIEEREKRHLQDVRAAGSFFNNPEVSQEMQDLFFKEKGVKSRDGRVPAGWLIEKAEMKGYRIGGALCSAQHPNYILNENGEGTADEVMMLASMIKARVRHRLHVQLQEEITMVGF